MFDALSVSATTSDKDHGFFRPVFSRSSSRMILRVFIPRYLQVDLDKGHFVYQIEVSTLGKFFRLEKRYSQFLALHNEVGS